MRENNRRLPESQPVPEAESSTTAEKFIQAGEYLFRKHRDITNPLNLLDEALNEFYRAAEVAPDAARVLARMAMIFVKKGNYAKAETLARKALAANRKLAEAHYVLGYIAYKGQSYRKCLLHLNEAIRRGGFQSSSSRFCLAYACQELSAQSNHTVGRLFRLAQACYYFLTGLALVGVGADRLNLGNLVHILPSVIKAYLKESNHDLDGALEELLKLYEKFPGLSSIQNMIGNLYLNKGLQEEAMYWYQRAIVRDPLNEEGHHQFARILEDRGEYEQALELYHKLLILKPNSAELHCSLGNVYYLSNRFEETIIHYRAAMQLSDDNSWKALLAQSLSKIYQENIPNRDAAQMAMQMAIDLNPQDVDNYIHLGVLLFEGGQYANAEILYERALKIAPRNAQLYSSLGYLKWMRNEITEAVNLYERAIELDPFYDIPHNNLGVIQLDTLGNVHQAVEMFEKAIGLNENYALAYYNMGRARSFLNDKLEAASCFKKAQELNEFTRELDNEELEDRIYKLFNASSETP